jgi:hypothetical protein
MNRFWKVLSVVPVYVIGISMATWMAYDQLIKLIGTKVGRLVRRR